MLASEGAGANLEVPAVSQSLAQCIHRHLSNSPFFALLNEETVHWGQIFKGI